METSYLISIANQIARFYMENNIGLRSVNAIKWVNTVKCVKGDQQFYFSSISWVIILNRGLHRGSPFR